MYKRSAGFILLSIISSLFARCSACIEETRKKMCSQQPITLMPFLGKRKAMARGIGAVRKPLDFKVIKCELN